MYIFKAKNWTNCYKAKRFRRKKVESGRFCNNPLMPSSDLEILLCLTPDDFTRQREAPWAL